ncbi:hypothetical protein CERZMDRAFT_97292 [Cercospora zeae-maydis SCOH1-5]|uniref:Uncharacterized protein n=1 Tax=Cercospora zeae-maydis SCOH1-5 TaxID=717836 RepID=A0A6A6FHN9_9PEZI|nr:hypothetical protein CERZMDRAFT_97292 [Cercospora zeae-maydis SCOH1-5]
MWFKYASSENGDGTTAYGLPPPEDPRVHLDRLINKRERHRLQVELLWQRLSRYGGFIRIPESGPIDGGGGGSPSAYARVPMGRWRLTEENLAHLRRHWERYQPSMLFVHEMLKQIVELEKTLEELEWAIEEVSVRAQQAAALEWSAKRWAAIARMAREEFTKRSALC